MEVPEIDAGVSENFFLKKEKKPKYSSQHTVYLQNKKSYQIQMLEKTVVIRMHQTTHSLLAAVTPSRLV